MTQYDRWLNGNDCCHNNNSTISPDCGKDCSCEAIYLEIDNLKTDVNVISGEVENKLDASAYTPTDLTDYYTKEEVDELVSGGTAVDAYTKAESDERFQPIGNYLSGNALNGYATEQWVEGQGYLTEHQPLKTINGEVISGSGNIVIEASGGSVTVDDHLDSASTNPVENKVIVGALNDKLDASAYTPADLSNYYNKQEVNNLIPTVPSNVSAFLNDAHYVTNAELVQYIVNLQQQISSLISTVSGCCSQTGETLYRWVTMTGENDYWCSGTTKMSMEKEQSSTDGLIWVDVSPETTRSGSTILEADCEDCGYIPSYGTKLTASYNNGNTQIIQCSGVWEDGFIDKRDYENLETGISGLTEAVIGTCPTAIAGYGFSGCTSLSAVTIPNNVTAIGAWSFLGCTSLTSITIPSGVTSISQSAFGGCRNLENFTCLATTPPALADQMFNSATNLIIYVPSASVNAYKSAYNWSVYADRIQGI